MLQFDQSGQRMPKRVRSNDLVHLTPLARRSLPPAGLLGAGGFALGGFALAHWSIQGLEVHRKKIHFVEPEIEDRVVYI
jgi:hypothetical protein